MAAGLLASTAIVPGAWAQAARAPSASAQTAQTAGAQAAAAPQAAGSSASQALSPAEQALRVRAEQFWSLWTAGQRVKALDLVAPDSRDMYLGQPLPPVTAFQFDKILKQDKPDVAVVYVSTEHPSPTPQFPGPIHSVSATVWKQIGGEWFLTMRDEAVIPTPYGPMKLNADHGAALENSQQLQKTIDQKSRQIDMKKIQEYIKIHDRIVSTAPGVTVKFAGDDQSQNPKDTKAQTPQTNGKKPAGNACPPAAGDKTSACPPH
ncbi:MAG TPA: hypothetical protein VGS20_04955 [Candidatus Acidoferrales bacterium]|nr:hypothetical protein [Candidatus Acidoferrales bacterium]